MTRSSKMVNNPLEVKYFCYLMEIIIGMQLELNFLAGVSDTAALTVWEGIHLGRCILFSQGMGVFIPSCKAPA